jgi:hypothetical protein
MPDKITPITTMGKLKAVTTRTDPRLDIPRAIVISFFLPMFPAIQRRNVGRCIFGV